VAGELVFFTGIVTNSGNATLNNVVVTDDQAGVVLDNLVLAPAEAVSFLGIYVATNCGPSVPSRITAIAADVCTGTVVSNQFATACPVGCQFSQPVRLFGALDGDTFNLFFETEPGHTYQVEFTDSLSPTNWQTLTTFDAEGFLATIPNNITNGQRFFRVLSQ
jgi:hypothetical protein